MSSAKIFRFHPKVVHPLNSARWHTKMGQNSSQPNPNGDATTPTPKLGTIFSSQTPYKPQVAREALDPKLSGADTVGGKGEKRKRDSEALVKGGNPKLDGETLVESVETGAEQELGERAKRRRRDSSVDSSVSVLGHIRASPIETVSHNDASKYSFNIQEVSIQGSQPTGKESFDVDGFGVAEDHLATPRHPLDDVPSEDEAIAETLKEYRATGVGQELGRPDTSGSSEQRFATPMTNDEAPEEQSDPQLPEIRPQSNESIKRKPLKKAMAAGNGLRKPSGRSAQNSIDITAQDIVPMLPKKDKKRSPTDSAAPTARKRSARDATQDAVLGVRVEKSPPLDLSRSDTRPLGMAKSLAQDGSKGPELKRKERETTFDGVRNSLWATSTQDKGKGKAVENVAVKKPQISKHGKGKEKLESRQYEAEPKKLKGPFEGSKFMARIREEQERENAMRTFAEAAYAATQLPKRASRDAASKRISDVATVEAKILRERENEAKAQRRHIRKSEPATFAPQGDPMDVDGTIPSAPDVRNDELTRANRDFTAVNQAFTAQPSLDSVGKPHSISPSKLHVAPLAHVSEEQPSESLEKASTKEAKAERARLRAERENAEREKRRIWLLQVKEQRADSQDPPHQPNSVAPKGQPTTKLKEQKRTTLLPAELDQERPATAPEKQPLIPIFSKTVVSTGRQLNYNETDSDSSDTEEEPDQTDFKLPTEGHSKSTADQTDPTGGLSAALLQSNTEIETSSSDTDDTDSTEETDQSGDEASNVESPEEGAVQGDPRDSTTPAKLVDGKVEETSSSETEEDSDETNESGATSTASTSTNFVDELAEPMRQTPSKSESNSAILRKDVSQQPAPASRRSAGQRPTASTKKNRNQRPDISTTKPNPEQSEESDDAESEEEFKLDRGNNPSSTLFDDEASVQRDGEADDSDSEDVMRSPISSEDELASTPARRVPKSAPTSAKSKAQATRVLRRKSAPALQAAARADTPSSTATRTGLDPRSSLSDEVFERLEDFKRRYCAEYNLDDGGFAARIHECANNNKRVGKFWDGIVIAVGWPAGKRPGLMKAVRRVYHNYRRARWTAAEDAHLASLHEQHGAKWRRIADTLERMPEDVRDRYRNHVKDADARAERTWSTKEVRALRRAIGECAALQIEATRREHGRADWRGWTPDLGSLVVWGIVSEKMGGTRSRAQCRAKATLMKRQRALNVTEVVEEGIARLRRRRAWEREGNSGPYEEADHGSADGGEQGEQGDGEDGEEGGGKARAKKSSRQSGRHTKNTEGEARSSESDSSDDQDSRRPPKRARAEEPPLRQPTKAQGRRSA